MYTTNKKFFDKKNIIKNQDANFKLTTNKNEYSKTQSVAQNDLKNIQAIYSKPYEPEDQYKDLAQKFKQAKFDIAYQVFQKAFPYEQKQDISFTFTQAQRSFIPYQGFDFNPINQERNFIHSEAFFQNKSDILVQFQYQSSTQQDDESIDQEESTKENSNKSKGETD